MPNPVDRRTVATALAALFAGAGTARAAEGLAGVVPPMASAGVIARRAAGGVAFQAVAGQAYGPAGVRPFALDQPFRVASISKMVAASVFLPLAQRKGLDLDADASGPVGFRLRHPAWPQTAITPRMLLSHTSSLRNGPSYPVPLGHRLAEAFEPSGRHYDNAAWFGPAEHGPGAWFAYADVNFALVAQMIERLSGERFDQHMRKALFAPMGLDIGYNWSGVRQAKRDRAAAAVHEPGGAPQVDGTVLPFPRTPFTRPPDSPDLDAADYRLGDNGFAFSPQGGLRLSLADMDALARLYAGGGRWKGRQLIPRAALEAMQTRTWTYDPVAPNGETDNGLLQAYGLGCEMSVGRSGPGSEDWRGHFGDAYGWITGLFWNRRDGRTLVYALNGMPETNRPKAANSSLTAPEEALIGQALRP